MPRVRLNDNCHIFEHRRMRLYSSIYISLSQVTNKVCMMWAIFNLFTWQPLLVVMDTNMSRGGDRLETCSEW